MRSFALVVVTDTLEVQLPEHVADPVIGEARLGSNGEFTSAPVTANASPTILVELESDIVMTYVPADDAIEYQQVIS